MHSLQLENKRLDGGSKHLESLNHSSLNASLKNAILLSAYGRIAFQSMQDINSLREQNEKLKLINQVQISVISFQNRINDHYNIYH